MCLLDAKSQLRAYHMKRKTGEALQLEVLQLLIFGLADVPY